MILLREPNRDAPCCPCFDEHAINAEVYVPVREMFVLFEGLLNAAQTRRMLLLREIRNARLAAGPAGLRR